MIDLDKLAAAVEQWGRAYTPESRAALAAVIAAAAPALIAELRQAREDVRRLRAVILRAGLWRKAPCCLCGYNGPGYYQPETHPCYVLAKTGGSNG